jgi:hypothetical protein
MPGPVIPEPDDARAGPAADPSPGPVDTHPRGRKALLLRLDPAVHEALARWAAADLRSLNAHLEWLLRRALAEARRMPAGAPDPPRRGRPTRD